MGHASCFGPLQLAHYPNQRLSYLFGVDPSTGLLLLLLLPALTGNWQLESGVWGRETFSDCVCIFNVAWPFGLFRGNVYALHSSMRLPRLPKRQDKWWCLPKQQPGRLHPRAHSLSLSLTLFHSVSVSCKSPARWQALHYFDFYKFYMAHAFPRLRLANPWRELQSLHLGASAFTNEIWIINIVCFFLFHFIWEFIIFGAAAQLEFHLLTRFLSGRGGNRARGFERDAPKVAY